MEQHGDGSKNGEGGSVGGEGEGEEKEEEERRGRDVIAIKNLLLV